MRIVWLAMGWASVGLGVIGAFVPVMPTVAFLLLGGWCFARSSPAAERWLLTHPRFGPPIRRWRRHGAIAPRAKRLALASLALSMAAPPVMGAPLWVSAVQAIVLAAVAAFLISRPDGPDA